MFEGPLAATFRIGATPDIHDTASAHDWRLEVSHAGAILLLDWPPQDSPHFPQKIFDLLVAKQFDRLADIDERFAAIFIDTDEVLLVRNWIGSRPLHFRIDGDRLDAATMPQDLARADDNPDWHWLARRAAMQTRSSDGTAYTDVKRVRPGHLVRWSRSSGRRDDVRFWRPDRTPLGANFNDVVAEADSLFASAMDRALAGATPPIAAQLTGGLDSSLVVSHAAKKASLVTLTGTHHGAPVDPGRGYFLDEAARAAATAKALDVPHYVARSDRTSLLDQIDTWQAHLGEPIANADNLSWLDPLYRKARDLSASRILTGALGNFTLSWPGSGALAELLRRGKLAQWWRSARAHRDRLGASRKGITALSLPWLAPGQSEQVRFIEGPAGNWRVARDRREVRADILLGHDPGPWHEAVRRLYGIDEVDGFADRRLVEFSLRLRESHCYQPGQPRALIRAMLRGRVDDAVIDEPKRGLQGADWPQRLAEALPTIRDQLARSEVPPPFDGDALQSAAMEFSPSDASTDTETEMRFDFTRAIAALRLGQRIGG
ncbi:asparagine synthase-related protein [Sphingomicrobium marinum]|uniref:asparagine synthase-related protein n=1 Tax=Sphingomicrobium marinum TaxID=1227950 RepID=UPI00223E907F|nr:asparagine synthetase B family protein [Sphingomicrobium marinum]